MTEIPDGLPTLSNGSHGPFDGQACVMEYVSVIAGLQFTDLPHCTSFSIALVAQKLNDRLADKDRHLLVPFIDRLVGLNATFGIIEKALVEEFGWPIFPAETYPGLDPHISIGYDLGSLMGRTVGYGNSAEQRYYRAVGKPHHYDPEAGLALFERIVSTAERVVVKKEQTPVTPEALARAKALVESRNYVPAV